MLTDKLYPPALLVLLFGLMGARNCHAQPGGRVLLPGVVPPAEQRLSEIGSLPPTNRVYLSIALPLRNEPALKALLQELYTPASPNFHRFLTPEEFTTSFGPTEQDYQAVARFATENGLKVVRQHANRLVLDVEGSATDVGRAFQVSLRNYRHPTELRNFYAPDRDPSIPANLPIVDAWGLTDFYRPKPLSHRVDPAKVTPLNNNGSGPSGSYLGRDFRNAYIPGASLIGSGQTAAVAEFDGYFASDITNYEASCGYTNVPLQNVLVDGVSGLPGYSGVQNAVAEVSLDIELIIAMAPGLSKVMVYEGNNPYDVFNRIVTDNLAKQISCSWTFGVGPTFNFIRPGTHTLDSQLQQMAAQGQSFFQASGDSDAYTGSQAITSSAGPIPEDSIYVTSVGGTSLTMNGTGASWASETVWNWGNNTGSGGGVSSNYPRPYWQTNVSMSANNGSTSFRNFPDVALTADAVYVVYSNGLAGIFGGTSCAAPLWAGFTSLVNQQSLTAGGTSVGFLNPALYSIADGANYNTCFHDITTGNNIGANTPGLYNAVTNYDLATGLGTPNGTNLVNALAPLNSPVFVSQPTNETILNGAQAVFAGTAGGQAPLHYQWLLFGTNLQASGNNSGTMSNVLTIAAVSTNDSGNYQLVVTNSLGSVTSSVATLTVVFPPSFTTQPTNQNVVVGGNASFSATVFGTSPLTYRWRQSGTNLSNGGNISGATSNFLLLSGVTLANSGNYTLVATNLYGAATSSVANLTVLAAGFSGGPTNGLVPLTVVFTNSSSGATNFSWAFGDGNVSSVTNPTNTFSAAGTYTVSLQAVGPGGTNVFARTNYIVVTNPPPVVAGFVGGPTNGVVPLPVVFTNLSSGATNYSWAFGDGKFSAQPNPTNTYASAGTYTVSLTAVGLAGTNILTRTNYVVVTNSPPVSGFVGGPTNGLVPLTVVFTNLSSGATNYSWAFGDGNVSALANPTNTYASAGTYTVSLNAVGLGGTNVLVRTNYVVVTNPPPVIAGFAGGPTNGLVPLTVVFTNLSSGATNYSWAFGDGNVSSVTGPTNTYASAGTYTVSLTAVGLGGTNVLTRTNYIVVTNPPPVIAGFAGGPTNGLVPLTVLFTNLSSGATNYNWAFGDGNVSNVASPTNTYASAGTYTVSLTAVGLGGTNVLTRTNYVVVTNPPPLIAGFAGGPTNGLVPLTVVFTNLSSGATNYSWAFGDGNVSALANPTNTYASAGTYTVSLTAVGLGGTNIFARTNYVVATNPPPVVASFAGGPTNGLVPLTVVFTNLSSGSTNYNWSFGDGNLSVLANPTNTYASAGTYTVSLTAVGLGGTNVLIRTNYVVVTNPPPVIAGFAAGPTNGLVPLTVVFTNVSSGATNYSWAFGDGNVSALANPTNTYASAGTYAVSLAAVGLGGTNVLTRTNYVVVTNPPPVIAGFVAGPTNGLVPLTVVFTNLSSGATNYSWAFGDGNVSSVASPTNTYGSAGVYTVSLTAVGLGGTNVLTRTNYVVVTNPPPVIAGFVAGPTNGLVPLTVVFTNLSSEATNYSWTFGDGNVSALANPTNTYASAGTYTVSLAAVGLGGTNVLTRTNYVVVTNPPPVIAGFAGGPTNGLVPLTVVFTNLSSGATNYTWAFGDGNASSVASPTNTYASAGTYTVSLTAVGLGGTNLLTRTNYVVVTNPPPVIAGFVAGPTNGLVPLTVVFTNLSSGATNYSWAFGDGNVSALANPTNTYASAGTYTVSLTAVGLGGTNVLARTNYVVVTNPPPVIAGFVGGPTNGLVPLTVVFANLSSGATNYTWAFGDGNVSSVASPTNTYGSAGVYTVSLTAVGLGGTNILTRTNYIVVTNPPPVIAGFAGGPTNGLVPLTVVFTNLSSGATNYSWAFGDGNLSASGNPTNTYASAGTYTVSLTAVGLGGTNVLMRTNYVVVTNPPPVIAGFAGGPTNGLVPLTVVFTNLSSGATNYSWVFGDGNASSVVNPTNTYASAGTYTVSLQAVGLGGTNILTVTNYVVVTNPPPVIAGFVGGPTNGLVPLTAVFTNLSSGATNYSWTFGDGNVSALANPTNTYSAAGTYTVSLMAVGLGGTNLVTQTNYIVVTNPPPVIAGFVAGPTNGLVPLTVVFTNLSTGATNYTWAFGDGNASTLANPTNTYSSTGSYTVSLTAVGLGGTNLLTLTNYVVVTNPPPVMADFAGVPTNGLVPLTVVFTNLSSGATTYTWAFGDGNESNVANPTNTYASAGVYTVSLTAVGLGGTNFLVLTNYVVVTNPPPVVAAFAGVPTNGLAPLTVLFTNFSVGATNYSWSFGDGNVSAFANPTNTFTNAGIFSVSLLAVGLGGSNTLTLTNYIVATNPPPVIAAFVGAPTNGLVPLTVAFTNLSSGATNYTWSFGDGNVGSLQNPINTYTSAGSYTVTLTAVGLGGTNILMLANYIVATNPPPVIAGFEAAPTNGLVPLTVVFTNLSSGATNYIWSFGDGSFSGVGSPTNTYTNAGKYSVTLTAVGLSGTNVLTLTNYIVATNPSPVLAVSPASIDFGVLVPGDTAESFFVVSNAGPVALIGSAAIGSGDFAILSGTPFSLDPSTTTNLVIQFAPSAGGGFTNIVTFVSNGGGSSNVVTGRAIVAPVLQVLPLSGTNFLFAFESVSGFTYEVQFKNAVDDPVWQPLTSLPGDGTTKIISIPVAAVSEHLYRLRVE